MNLAKIKPYAHVGITVLSLLIGGGGLVTASKANKEVATMKAAASCPVCAPCVAKTTIIKPDPIRVEFPGFIPVPKK